MPHWLQALNVLVLGGCLIAAVTACVLAAAHARWCNRRRDTDYRRGYQACMDATTPVVESIGDRSREHAEADQARGDADASPFAAHNLDKPFRSHRGTP